MAYIYETNSNSIDNDHCILLSLTNFYPFLPYKITFPPWAVIDEACENNPVIYESWSSWQNFLVDPQGPNYKLPFLTV